MSAFFTSSSPTTMSPSLSQRAALMLLALALLLAPRAAAETILYQFTGVVRSVSNPPYDLPFDEGQPVLGKFIYDTSAAGTPVASGNDGFDYRQHFVNGFTARIGPAVVFADDYFVTVVNDLPQSPSGPKADQITIGYSSSFTPPLGSPLHVNGEQKTGVFELNFLGTPTLFDEPEIPASIKLSDFYGFSFTSGFLTETPFRIAIFEMLSLERLDELPGDFNRDDVVDGADLLVLQRAAGSSQSLANGVHEPTIGAANLQLWSDNFRSTLAAQVTTSIPEPATSLLAAAVTLLLRQRPQHRPSKK